MPADPTTAKDMLFSSDYPIDKVVYRTTQTVNVPSATFLNDNYLFTIPHGLGFRPLLSGVFSDDNFSTYYEFGNPPYAYSTTFALWLERINIVAESDETNIYIRAINFDTTRDIKVKIVGLSPTDSATISAPISAGVDPFTFSTDYNYMKIYSQGIAEVSLISGALITDITHNLGYVPSFRVWSEYNGAATKQSGFENLFGVSALDTESYADTTKLRITSNSGGGATAKLHYRIYLDD